jgi:hypothetical protein
LTKIHQDYFDSVDGVGVELGVVELGVVELGVVELGVVELGDELG